MRNFFGIEHIRRIPPRLFTSSGKLILLDLHKQGLFSQNAFVRFCVDSDVSRIEAADKRTFDTIAQYSNHVPVFVVGTKKDKLVAFHKIQLLEKYMEQTGNYPESQRLANQEADRMAEEQFLSLREELSRIEHYKADGYCCLSKGQSKRDL